MRVICIDNTAKSHPDVIGYFMVKEGEVYSVTGGFEIDGEYFYILAEDIGGNGWNSIYFIPLSNADNKMLKNEKAKV